MRHTSMSSIFSLLLSAIAFTPSTTRAEPPKLLVPATDQSAVGQRGYFYVGGKYVGEPGKEVMQGQAYVEVLAPKEVRRAYPLVLIHGAGQTATNWMGTPDGRKGWAEYFVEQGYVVYMIDQPMRGRSALHPSDGATRTFTAANDELQFTAIESAANWPQAKKHTNGRVTAPTKVKRATRSSMRFTLPRSRRWCPLRRPRSVTAMPAPRSWTASALPLCSLIRSRALSAG